MITKQNSDARRLAIQSELEILTMESFMKDRKIANDASRFAKIVEYINVLTLQGPSNVRSENNKVRHLCHAVLAKPWTERATGIIATANCSFRSFVTALCEQFQLNTDKGLRATDSSSSTFYQGCGRHLRRDAGYTIVTSRRSLLVATKDGYLVRFAVVKRILQKLAK